MPRLRGAEALPDCPEPGEVMHVLSLGWYLGDGNERVSRGESLGKAPFGGS